MVSFPEIFIALAPTVWRQCNFSKNFFQKIKGHAIFWPSGSFHLVQHQKLYLCANFGNFLQKRRSVSLRSWAINSILYKAMFSEMQNSFAFGRLRVFRGTNNFFYDFVDMIFLTVSSRKSCLNWVSSSKLTHQGCIYYNELCLCHRRP